MTGSPEARRQVLLAHEETPRHRAALKLLQEMSPGGFHPDGNPCRSGCPLNGARRRSQRAA